MEKVAFREADLQVKCPLCRCKSGEFIYQYIVKTAASFLTLARRYSHGEDNDELVRHYTQFAREEVDKIPSELGAEAGVRALHAEVLMMEGNYEEALAQAELLYECYQNDFLHTLRTQCLIGEIHLRAGDYRKALETFTAAYGNFTEANCHLHAIEQRQILSSMSRCHYELKNYDRALGAGEMAVAMNRTYDGCYRYIALSWEALGNYERAKLTWMRAIRFETPWDAKNVASLHKSLKDLNTRIASQESQR